MVEKEPDGNGPPSRHHISGHMAWFLEPHYGQGYLGCPWGKIGKVGGAQAYLQLVNMITIKMTNLESLLTQVQVFQENYTRILTSGHSKISEDLAMFTFCSALLSSYEETACQYLVNINDITKYKLSDMIAQVLQCENHQKANSIVGGSSLNKFSMVKNLSQKWAKCGKTNHSTQNHWPGGKCPQYGKRKSTPKVSTSSKNKGKLDKKRKRQREG